MKSPFEYGQDEVEKCARKLLKALAKEYWTVSPSFHETMDMLQRAIDHMDELRP